MSTRLPIDGGLSAYFGFDEANPSDPAVDEAGQGTHNLIFYNAPAVMPARLGNGRQFDGATTYAQPADSTGFQAAINTIIVWFTLDSVNQAGDMLRPILTLEGPGASVAEDTVHGLYIDNNGALVYRYTGSSREDCVYRTATGLFRVNRYYSVALVRTTAPLLLGGGRLVTLYVNNQPVVWASRSVSGVVQADPAGQSPVEATTGLLTVFKVGASSKTASKWHGVIDELSLHSIGRPKAPYLDAAYFRLTLATTFSRLTTKGNIKILAAVDMGGGTRWWCYERDQSIYVIRENSLGLFSAEVQLTQGGSLANGAPMPGGVGKPRLAYDAVTDTLVIVFMGGGRVYKVTGLSSDLPTNLVMPYTQDTAIVIKTTDSKDLMRTGVGEPSWPFGFSSNENLPSLSAAVVVFLQTPSFGVAVYGANPTGYALYEIRGTEETFLGAAVGPKQTARPLIGPAYWFFPVASRSVGTQYRAYAYDTGGHRVTKVASNIIADFIAPWNTNVRPLAAWDLNAVSINTDQCALTDNLTAVPGEANLRNSEWGSVKSLPIKLLVPDVAPVGVGEGNLERLFVRIGATPIKFLVLDAALVGAGEGTFLTANTPTRSIRQ